MDRSGYARATLAVREGLSAPVPPMDPIYSRTMIDMGMAMSGMSGMNGGMDMKGMEGMNMSGMSGMTMPQRQHGMSGMTGKGNMSGMRSMSWMTPPRPNIPHSVLANANGQIAYPQPQDVQLRIGPEVVHIAQHPTERLDRPGDGLNNNGRRVLTYTDLVRLATGPQNIPFGERDPDAEVMLHLTGNMDRYIFGFNGLTYDQSEPVRYPYGQRFWVTIINDTMMEHPIHLHGLFTELDSRPDRLRPLKHTVSVKPGEKVHYYLTANELGRWAYHCHLLYHMEAGMFTSAVIA
jgi:FtsP/CotA-like multicopper oxidase with cupredoxin domain